MSFKGFHKSTIILFVLLLQACAKQQPVPEENQLPIKQSVTAKDILGNPDYQAISYGGYREISREVQPTVDQLKEDMRILHAMGIRVLRTYNVHFPHAENVLEAIRQIKDQDGDFEMYVMLGAWINCQGAFTDQPNHEQEDETANQKEIDKAVALANQYEDIVKVIAVGNEAMVKWATSYYVQPGVILRWVNYLQDLKSEGQLSTDLWITSSDNFASWGGGDAIYHTEDLEALIQAVDYISLHTYPMHDTHYNPDFWGVNSTENQLSDLEKIDAAMQRGLEYAVGQFKDTQAYIQSLGVNKPIHIGETGWASVSNGHYGNDGSKATDEYKEAKYFQQIREWSDKNGVSCFYFEAFDEQWKDAGNASGSENHFGLITLDGQAKYALWELVDQGVFSGLSRGGNIITKTYSGSMDSLLLEVMVPDIKNFAENDAE